MADLTLRRGTPRPQTPPPYASIPEDTVVKNSDPPVTNGTDNGDVDNSTTTGGGDNQGEKKGDGDEEKEEGESEKADGEAGPGTGKKEWKKSKSRPLDLTFHTVKKPGMQFVTTFKFDGKSLPMYGKEKEVLDLLSWFNLTETKEQKEAREKGRKSRIFVPNLYGPFFKKTMQEDHIGLTTVDNATVDNNNDNEPELMELSYEPRKQEFDLMPSTLEARERLAEELRAKSPDYTTERERRVNSMREALVKALQPNYDIKNEEAKIHRANQIFWSRAWDAMPAGREVCISLAKADSRTHTIILLEGSACRHVHHPRVFHVLLPQVFLTMDNEWLKSKELRFKDGFLNFLGVFVEHGYHLLSLNLNQARGEPCYNQLSQICFPTIFSQF
jgi:hypothetical protein